MTTAELRALPIGTTVRTSAGTGLIEAIRVDAFRDGDGWQIDGIEHPVSSLSLPLYGARWEPT